MDKEKARLAGIVLDWAGTTVDYGSRAPAMVFQQIFQEKGIDISLAQAREPMGMAKREHIAAIAAMPPIAQAWVERYGKHCGESDIDAMYHDFLPLQKSVLHEYSEVIEGVPEAVQCCRELGLAIGSSTGYTRELMEIVAPVAAEQGYAPDFYLCSEDAPRGRPAPFLLFEAAKRFDVFPMWKIVKVDDTTLGIEAGRNANCWTIGIAQTGNLIGLSPVEWQQLSATQQSEMLATASSKLREAGAHFVVNSVAEVPQIVTQINALLEAGQRS
ncbi:MAG: phosphonoacetaldehyde hydrolase [bacterium]|nr:phosphonoacetaldehyde hydrolase [bacterium]